jgi:uncharacterized membrane protein
MTLVVAAVVHFLAVLATPHAIGFALQSLAESNTLVHAEKPAAGNDQVRRSSPDLVYSACVFDLTDGPLHITAPAPESYMSVSFFASNTDNFWVKNDRHVDGTFDVVLAGPGTTTPDIDGAELVRSPTMTGGVIFRYFAGDGRRLEEIESLRQQISIRPLASTNQKGQ